MRPLAGLAAAVLFASLAARAALADELIMADGASHTCEVLSVEEKGVRAKGTMKSGGTVELFLPVARLDPHWFYVRRDASLGNDAKARVQFAVWCVENDFFSRARIQMKKATDADPKLVEDLATGKYAEIREGIAGRVLASAESDIDKGRLDPAREKLEILLGRLSDTAAGDKARDTLKALEAKADEAESKAEAARQAKLAEAERKADTARARVLENVDDDFKKGREQALAGLSEDNVNKALELLEKALGRGESAMKKLDSIEKEHAADAETMAAAKERRTKLVNGMVKVRIHRADLYIWRGSLPNAKEEIEAARKLDPANTAIDAAMARVLAADEDDALELRYLRERRASGSRFGGRGRGR